MLNQMVTAKAGSVQPLMWEDRNKVEIGYYLGLDSKR